MRGSKRFFIEYMAPLAVALALCGCSRLAVEPKVEAGSVRGEVVTAGLAGTEAVYSTGGWPLRTLAPDPVAVNDLATTQYTLKIRGESHRDSLPEQVVQLNADGSFVIPSLSYGVWRLTLTAYRGASATALLTGSSSVTVDGSPGTTARFVLTPAGVAGTGSFYIGITWSDVDRALVYSGWQQKARRYEMGLFDPVTEKPVRANLVGAWEPAAGRNEVIDRNFNWDRQNIPAGQYLFKYTITGGGLPDGVSLCWRDNVYIEPGRETRQSVTIPQMAVMPASPANFTETCTTLTATGSYTATLGWNGVYNASGYELEIMKYASGIQRPTDDATWEAAGQTSSVYTYNTTPGDSNNYTNSLHPGGLVARYQSGGLLPGQTSIRFAMKMNCGEGFTARMRAVNGFGNSDWVYLGSPLVPDVPLAPSSFAFKVGSVDDNDSFGSVLTWTGGIFDAGGTYELELQRFTGGAEPINDATWGQATGRATVVYTSAMKAWTHADITEGDLTASDSTVTVTMRNTGGYYTARLRAKNSNGNTSAWVYLGDTMIPSPSIPSHRSTAVDKRDGYGQLCWWAYLSVCGPQRLTGMTGYKQRWIVWRSQGPTPVIEDEATWTYIKDMNAGSQDVLFSDMFGKYERQMRDMNPNLPFLFCIRTETSYGNSPWFFYRDEVRQLP